MNSDQTLLISIPYLPSRRASSIEIAAKELRVDYVIDFANVSGVSLWMLSQRENSTEKGVGHLGSGFDETFDLKRVSKIESF